jgi:uncharacterized membrane protein YdjX (TVP38/TMEM64 family)
VDESLMVTEQLNRWCCMNRNSRAIAEQIDADSETTSQPPAALPSATDSLLARHWQKIVAALIWAGIIGALFAYIRLNDLTIGGALRRLVALMQTPYGPLIYVLAYALRPLTFFSSIVLTLSAGAIFGPVWGIVFTVIAANSSATVAYFMGRALGSGVFDHSQSTGIAQRYAGRMRQSSFETTLIMRFVFLPYDLVSYLAGFLRIGYRAFILATILGSLPGTVSFVLAGASVQVADILDNQFRPKFNPWSLVISVALFIVSVAFSRYLKRREARREPGARE